MTLLSIYLICIFWKKVHTPSPPTPAPPVINHQHHHVHHYKPTTTTTTRKPKGSRYYFPAPNIGQAHDMFSRIFRIRIYEFFLPNNICFDFSKCLKLSRKCLFWPICFLFQLRNIGEKIHRFLFWKFVKTCREFNISCGHIKRAPFLGLVSTRSVLQSGHQIRQRKSSICQIRFNGTPFSHWNCQFDE